MIFPENDSNALAANLNRLIESASERADYTKRGRERVLRLYTQQRCADILDETLRAVLELREG